MFSNHSWEIHVVNGDSLPQFQSLNDETPQLNTGPLNYLINFLFFLMKKQNKQLCSLIWMEMS